MNLMQIDRAITGVWAILLRKKNALRYFSVNATSFAWSFAVVIVVLMFQTYMAPLETQIFNSGDNKIELGEVMMGLQSLILIINWFLWPLITFFICKLMGLSAHYIRYVIVDNWSSVVTLTIIGTPSILFQFGLSADLAKSFIFFSSFIMLIYKWRVIKVALATSGMYASILLFIDIAVTILVSTLISKIIAS
ncbi:MAG: hypothetical protein COC24_006735 [Alphaproteobacteria bacterium]|nr:hypothetical protein [Alphaproteobacteria bacterium]